MALATEQGRAYALEQLAERRKKAKEIGQIDNSKLYAGSPMYFYCVGCGLVSDELPENYFLSRPKKICKECQALKELGWLE